MARQLLALALLCMSIFSICVSAMPGSSRLLLQSGPARFMNAPITNIAKLEALEDEEGPAQPKLTIEQASSPKAAVKPIAANITAQLRTKTKPQQPQQQVQQQQQRGLLAADSADLHRHRHHHHHHDKRWRQERIRSYSSYRSYDRGTLSPLLTSVNSYSSVRRQPLPALTGLLGSLLLTGNPQGTAQSLAKAYNGGDSEAAAQAVASAACAGSGAAQANTVAQAISETATSHPNVAPGLLAKSADLAVKRGQTDRYAQTLAKSFGYAKQQQQVPQLTDAVIQAITTGGDAARYASGTAIATAIAQGGDSKAAVAEATATALCAGGSQAQAWSSAYAVALAQDKNGCLVLNEARAMAQAKCGDGAADAVADAEASSTVLGFCGLLEGLFPDTEMSWSGGYSGSTSTGDGWGRQGSWGQGSWGQSGWGK